jgi:hypothetical protein
MKVKFKVRVLKFLSSSERQSLPVFRGWVMLKLRTENWLLLFVENPPPFRHQARHC